MIFFTINPIHKTKSGCGDSITGQKSLKLEHIAAMYEQLAEMRKRRLMLDADEHKARHDISATAKRTAISVL